MKDSLKGKKKESGKLKPTERILSCFEKISAIPRASKCEEKIRRFFLEWAENKGFVAKTDEVGNVLVEIPGTNKRKQASPIIIQGHLDMVCEKEPDCQHDFSTDPIKLVHDGDWIHADRTSLGADNGIALAMAMALAEEANISHPPLELLFTVDEETGLTGAGGLKPGFFKGKILLNLDSEDEGVFTVGCAGGRDTFISLPLQYESVPPNYQAFVIKAFGITGGHSGVNINEERANAIQALVRILDQIRLETDLRIIAFYGGTAHNAIPRESHATIFIPPDDLDKASRVVVKTQRFMESEYRLTDPKFGGSMSFYPMPVDDRAMTPASTGRVIDLMMALPHGVMARSTEIKDLVETSNNLAKVSIEGGKLHIETSQRSSVMSRLDLLTTRIETIAKLAGAEVKSNKGYPSWQPNLKSPLLLKCLQIYKSQFGKDAKVEVIHAGLECGIIGNIDSEMDMISFGATLKDPHSPRERLHVPSIEKVWNFLIELLQSF